jgi:hypothetical protein
MREVLDAFWRAAGYCIHPRVMLWSLLPVLLAGGVMGLLGWAYWEPAVAAVRNGLEQWSLVAALLQWLDSIGAAQLRTLLAPMIVVALMLPLVVIASLLLVALAMTPAVVNLVAARRFPQLQRRQGAAWWQGLLWSLACTAGALLALLGSLPLWFVPPLVLVLPPLIWGWLTYRVFAFDVLAAHATAQERRIILRRRRWPMLTMGVTCGFLLYTLVFTFAACWFAHYALADLQRLRGEPLVADARVQPEPSTLSLAPPA